MEYTNGFHVERQVQCYRSEEAVKAKEESIDLARQEWKNVATCRLRIEQVREATNY
jgi:hypothetical protein